MAEDLRIELFVGALVGSGASFVLLILMDFGGWCNTYYHYFYSLEECDCIGVSNPLTLAILIPMGLPFLFITAVSLKGAINPNSLTMEVVTLTCYLSVIELFLIFVGTIIFIAVVSGSDEWWFGGGFYGPAIGGILTFTCLIAARGYYRIVFYPPRQYPQFVSPGVMQYQGQQYRPAHLPPPPQQVSYQNVSPQNPNQPVYYPPASQAPPPYQATPQQGQQPYVQGSPQYPAGMKYCRRCGTQAVTGPYCPRCGFPIQ